MKIRKNVAAVIVNSSGLILVGNRRDVPGQWQLPQGGIDENESPEKAVLREVEEETGLNADEMKVVAFTKPVSYLLPEHIAANSSFDGQEQIYFLLELKGEEIQLAPSDEFSAFKWLSAREILDNIVYFKKKCYEEAFEQLFGDQKK
jgi:putative (di)nucleoside polyphosphate hydrolase